MPIHPTAIIDPKAQVHPTVIVGAYAYIGPGVVIGPHTCVYNHATIMGDTIMGEYNEVFPYAYIGAKTHDLKYDGGVTSLRIGNYNVFREYVSVHCATSPEGQTTIGSHNNILAYSHVAHDCKLGNNIVMSSHAALGGHVTVGHHANIGWGVGVHQFCRVGDYAMIGATTKLVQDAPPYMIIDGNPAEMRAVNKIGMERGRFTSNDVVVARNIFRAFVRQGLNHTQAIEAIQASKDANHPLVHHFITFVRSSTRGIV